MIPNFGTTPSESSSFPEVYEPAEDSYLLQKQIRKYANGRVLDLGTGSGIQALTAVQTPNVREVVAVDINKKALELLEKKIKEQKLRKINVLYSNLFQHVEGQFNLILFNPPYLPQDKVKGEEIIDPALYGGKKGWELSEQFFKQASRHLASDGQILFLFSSLTNQQKIEKIIASYLFTFKVIEEKKLPMFETLYIYLIEKSTILKELEKKHIENITYFTQGKRGRIFTGTFDKSKLIKTHFSKKDIITVGIKVKREDSKAQGRITNESLWLKKLNKYNIGPRLLFDSFEPGNEYLVYEFVEGELIGDWVKKASKKEAVMIFHNLLEQCFTLDRLKVNKEEMHRSLKHILITTTGPVMLDFERCHEVKKPQNVVQFVESICRMKGELEKKGIPLDVKKLRELSKKYKEEMNFMNFKSILAELR